MSKNQENEQPGKNIISHRDSAPEPSYKIPVPPKAQNVTPPPKNTKDK